MEGEKRTTFVLPESLYRQIHQLAGMDAVSAGEIIRRSCALYVEMRIHQLAGMNNSEKAGNNERAEFERSMANDF